MPAGARPHPPFAHSARAPFQTDEKAHAMLRAALCAALLAAAAGVGPAPEPMRRRLQSGTICAADLSGRIRGIPDGRVNVMDVCRPCLSRDPWLVAVPD